MRKRRSILFITVIIIASMGALSIYYRAASTDSIRFLTGTGSSMEPTLTQNDVIILTPVNPELLRVGDIITYERELDGGNKIIFVTHRIVEIEDGGIRTKGDAMPEADECVVKVSDVKGKVVGKIPYAALLVRFVHTTYGYLLFILAPASLLIGMELKKILKARKQLPPNKGGS